MTARIGFWLALVAAGALSGGYLMWGQVQDARYAAKAAEDQAVSLGKQLAEVMARQASTDALLAARKRSDNALTAQLKQLRSDLDKAFRHDPETAAWSDTCVPGVVADRLRLPADPDCNRP